MGQVQRGLAVLILASAGLVGCRDASANGGAGGGEGRPYKIGVVDRGSVRVVVEETGVVEPERQIIVKSPISGVVQQLLVREGDRVGRGKLLARIVPDIAQANTFARIRSEIASARIAQENAEREYQRALQLSETGGIAQADLDQRRVDLDQARNQFQAALDQLKLIEMSGVTTAETTQWARIVAPAAGVVIRRGVEVGETVVGGTSAFGGGTELFTIADLSTLLVKAAVNEVDIGKVRVGDSVSLSVDAFPEDTVSGTVRLVPPAARQQERVRVFDVEIEAHDGGGVLRPGMTANVAIAGPSRVDVTRAPVEAVFLSEGAPVVYRVSGDQHEQTAVRLGLSDLSFVEILSGVAEGDTVALEDPAAAIERANNPARRR